MVKIGYGNVTGVTKVPAVFLNIMNKCSVVDPQRHFRALIFVAVERRQSLVIAAQIVTAKSGQPQYQW